MDPRTTSRIDSRSHFAAPARRFGPWVGIGLRAPHYRELLETRPAVGWMEVHSENYFGAGGQPLHFLDRFRALYPVSLHGVGLAIGSADPLACDHLRRLSALIDRVEPMLVSEHLCWGAIGGRHLNDLLPLPYTDEALSHVCARIGQAQDLLRRRLLVENISSYLECEDADMPEWEFVAEVARRTGCAILLDVNNVYVSAVNHAFDPLRYLEAIPVEAVAEFHLAGFDRVGDLLIDTHGTPVSEPVWALYRHAVERFGERPTLVEWDTDLPALPVLLGEAAKASSILDAHRVHAVAAAA